MKACNVYCYMVYWLEAYSKYSAIIDIVVKYNSADKYSSELAMKNSKRPKF